MSKSKSPLKEGGAKERGGSLSGDSDPALQGNERQAVLNQGTVKPEDYPDRQNTATPKEKPSSGD